MKAATVETQNSIGKYICQSCRVALDFTNVEKGRDGTPPQDLKKASNSRQSQGGSRLALGESFVDVANSSSQTEGGTAGGGLNTKDAILQDTFEAASLQLEAGFPMCLNCTEELRASLKQQIRQVEEEVRLFEEARERLEQQAGAAGEETNAQLEADVAQAEQDVEAYRKEVAALEDELAATQAEVAAAQRQAREVSTLEEQYWSSFNDFQTRLAQHLDERDCLLAKVDGVQASLDELQHAHVLDDCFRIWHVGEYGTISGLRLGLSQSKGRPDWDEVNAAWGQCVLLLSCVIQSCGITLTSGLHPIPLGSTSAISDAKGKSFPLHGPPGLRLHLFASDFDQGMTLFLAAMKEVAGFFVAAAQRQGQTAEPLPFPVEEDKLLDVVNKKAYSVRFSLNHVAKWNKALKHMLADLKFLAVRMLSYQRGQELG